MPNKLYDYTRDYQTIEDMVMEVKLYKKTKSDAILNRIISHKLYYAFSVASKNCAKVRNMQFNSDLMQTLAIAIYKAIEDVPVSDIATSFTSYIYNKVRDAVREFDMKELMAINVSDQVKRTMSKIKRLSYEYPNYDKAQIRAMIACSNNIFDDAWNMVNTSVVSCDVKIDGDSEHTYQDLIESDHDTPEDVFNRNAACQELYSIMKKHNLSDKSIDVYSRNKGLFGMNVMSVTDIAKLYKVSHPYISKIIKEVEIELGIRG